jgi:propionate CoA-transferase
VEQVEHRTFSGREALRRGQRVRYVTERCVFQLTQEGLELIEIAPGVDLQHDILAQMDFKPLVSPSLGLMDARLFADVPMGLRDQLLSVPLSQRLELDAERQLLYIDFSGLNVLSEGMIGEIESSVRRCLAGYPQVAVVVNYDHFNIAPDLIDKYAAMVQRLSADCYGKVTRYGTGGFLKAKLERTSQKP